jgi:hypothetical protein
VEREGVLTVLCLVLCGPLCLLGGVLVRPATTIAPSGRRAEVHAWRRLWLPILPALSALALVIGWALNEPDASDAVLTPVMLAVALPAAVIAGRTVARAVRALWTRQPPLAGTVGLVRPTTVISEELRSVLAEDELAAVEAHELAHVRHRDPLRIWVGQIIADVQWPARSAELRFRQWLHALELARDEEARDAGADGPALAAAVVDVARRLRTPAPCGAHLVGQAELLRDRIARLLSPLTQGRHAPGRVLAAVVIIVLVAALSVGFWDGDSVLRHVPGVLST